MSVYFYAWFYLSESYKLLPISMRNCGIRSMSLLTHNGKKRRPQPSKQKQHFKQQTLRKMKKILAALITSIVILGSSFQTAKTVKEQLIGTWIFESYSYPASFPASAEDSLEANNSYAGQYFVFMPGNKVIMGSRSQKHNANYSLSKDSKEVEINDQKMMVDRLDGTHLSLTIPDHGTMTFKRKI